MCAQPVGPSDRPTRRKTPQRRCARVPGTRSAWPRCRTSQTISSQPSESWNTAAGVADGDHRCARLLCLYVELTHCGHDRKSETSLYDHSYRCHVFVSSAQAVQALAAKCRLDPPPDLLGVATSTVELIQHKSFDYLAESSAEGTRRYCISGAERDRWF